MPDPSPRAISGCYICTTTTHLRSTLLKHQPNRYARLFSRNSHSKFEIYGGDIYTVLNWRWRKACAMQWWLLHINLIKSLPFGWGPILKNCFSTHFGPSFSDIHSAVLVFVDYDLQVAMVIAAQMPPSRLWAPLNEAVPIECSFSRLLEAVNKYLTHLLIIPSLHSTSWDQTPLNKHRSASYNEQARDFA